MFGDVAVTLLKMAGHSGTVPGALVAREVPAALARLQRELAAASEEDSKQNIPADTGDDDAPPPVPLKLRAFPLIELLTAAARQECDVMWERGAPLV